MLLNGANNVIKWSYLCYWTTQMVILNGAIDVIKQLHWYYQTYVIKQVKRYYWTILNNWNGVIKPYWGY